jgi:hypothetical protein
MKLATSVRLPFPRDAVFAAYRDSMVRILEFLPNVRVVEPRSREVNGAVVASSSEWHGGGEVPAAVRGIVAESMLAWTDHSSWNGDSYVCDWRAESHSFADGIRCQGRTTFVEEPEGATRLEVHGAVEVDARRLPGVPSFLARSVARHVEEFLVGRIQTNLAETARWFEKYGASTPEGR